MLDDMHYKLSRGSRVNSIFAGSHSDTMKSMVQKPAINIKESSVPAIKTKRCYDCTALLPIEEFGSAKWTKDGYRNTCKSCRKEDRVEFWLRSKQFVHKKYAPDLIRNVKLQNTRILRSYLSKPRSDLTQAQLHAFHCIDKTDYRVILGPCPDKASFRSLTVYSHSGDFFRELTFSGREDNIVEVLVQFLKMHELRLELTEYDAHVSKTMIYYL